VILTETLKGTAHPVTTNAEGRYAVLNVPAGPCTLEVQAERLQKLRADRHHSGGG